MRELCALTDTIVREAFGAPDPTAVQFQLEGDDFRSTVESLRRGFRKNADAKGLFRAVLEHAGVEPERTGWDWLHLRVLPHGEGHAGSSTSGLGFHRDTWSSNVYAQTNWWAPIYPITAARTVAFYPRYWGTPLANTSAEWDLEEVRRKPASLPLVPRPTEAVDTSDELRLVPEPGDLLCFSGAHLHASTPNESGRARFSIEVRTVHEADLARRRGAPNVDGSAPHVAVTWFRRVSDNSPLTG